MKGLDVIVWTLLVIGGLNWGLIGIFEFNLVSWIFQVETLIRAVYVIVGLAALYDIVMIKSISNRWDIHWRRRPATA